MIEPAAAAPVRRGIQTRLAVLVLTAALAPMLVLGASSLTALASMREALLAERRALVASTAREVEREVRAMLEALSAVNTQPDTLRAARLRSRLLSEAMLVQADGPIPSDLRNCAGLREIIRGGKPVVCDPSSDPGSAAARFVIVPLRDTAGRNASAAVGRIDLDNDAWAALLPQETLPPRASIRLEDQDGGLLAGHRPPAAGTDDVGVSQRLTVLPWAVRFTQPADDAFAPVQTLERRWLALGIPLGALAGLFAWGVSRSVKTPLAKLEQAAARIAAGDITRPLPPLGEDEVGRLGASFEAMRKALAKDETRRRLLRKVIGAQEEERKRIARELHDDTCQVITAIKLKLAAAGIADGEAMANRSLDELHRIIYDLRPSVLDDLGLLSAIRWVATRDLTPLGVQVRCELEEPAPKLPFEVEIALFRAVQEAIHNIVRHARAETVLIEAIQDGRGLEIVIEDDGAGFDVDEVAAPSASGRGLGILGIHERMELIRGEAKVTSAPGRGTRVTLRVPLAASMPAAAMEA